MFEHQTQILGGFDPQTPLAYVFEHQTQILGGFDPQTPLVNGLEHQTQILGGFDPQTPLVNGSDFIILKKQGLLADFFVLFFSFFLLLGGPFLSLYQGGVAKKVDAFFFFWSLFDLYQGGQKGGSNENKKNRSGRKCVSGMYMTPTTEARGVGTQLEKQKKWENKKKKYRKKKNL